MFCVVDVSLVRRVEGKLLLLEVVAWEEMVSVIEIRILFCRRDAQQVIGGIDRLLQRLPQMSHFT